MRVALVDGVGNGPGCFIMSIYVCIVFRLWGVGEGN